jgi:hypothetical protein
VHKLEEELLLQVWNQFNNQQKKEEGIVLNWEYGNGLLPQSVTAPGLPVFYKRDPQRMDGGGMILRNGFTVDISFNLNDLAEGQVLVDARDPSGKGWYLRISNKKTLEILLHDGRTQSVWDCDEGMLKPNQSHYVSVIVDGGPRIIAFVVDGVLNDGGETRQFGWGRFNPFLQSVSEAKMVEIGHEVKGEVNQVSIYDRAIKVSEAIGNYHANRNNSKNRN